MEAIASGDIDAVKQLLAEHEIDVDDDTLADYIIEGALDADPEKMQRLATILDILLNAGMPADETFEAEILDNERYPLVQTYLRLRPKRIRPLLSEMSYQTVSVVERVLSEFSITSADANALFDVALRRKTPNSLLAKLLERGANVNQLNGAIRAKHPGAVDFLLAHGADVNAKDQTGYTPLHTTIIMSDIQSAKKLLAHGADTTITNADGETPARMAQEYEEDEFVELFGVPKTQTVTVDDVILAIINKDSARLQSLIPNIKFDINTATGSNKRTILGTAVTAPEMLPLVLSIPDIEIDAPATHMNEYTALHYAVLTSKAVEIVPILLNAGANPNAKAIAGETPLMAMLRKPTNPLTFLMKQFVEHGADVTLKNALGKTVLDIATEAYADLSESANDYDEEGPDPTIQSAMSNIQSFIEYVGPMMSSSGTEREDEEPEAQRVHDEAAERFLANAQKIPGFDVRVHVTATDVLPVYTTVLPKGTLLFRGLNNARQAREDILGIARGTNAYCLSPHYEVFFYPFPFVDKTVNAFANIAIYVLLHDTTVASFINPCPLARADRSINGMPIVSCNTLSEEGNFGCGITGRKYDPCFDDDFLRKNPDITGMVAIAGVDRKNFIEFAQKEGDEINRNLNKYISVYSDSHNLYPGIPELILYPRLVHYLEDKTTWHTESDTIQDYIEANREHLTYMPFHTIVGRSPRKITEFMEQITSADGFNGYHARIDMTTGFYVIEEILGSEDGLLPVDEHHRMAETFPELRFTRAVLPGFTPPTGSGRRHTRRKHALK